MKIFQINGGVFGSTGKIMFGIAETARKHGHEVVCASPVTTTNRYREPEDDYIKIGTFYGRCVNVLLARLTGYEGCFSLIPTIRLIKKIKKFGPDIIHLHSLHNSFVNLQMLFKFLKKSKAKVVWTLHDCWAFTGHCPHFEYVGCDKWKTECKDCLKYTEYPKTYRDNSKKMHKLKKKWFSGLGDMVIITPSKWLAAKVKESFLGNYRVEVVNNGIDLDVFKPTDSDFRKKYDCDNKHIVLGVSFGWSNLKGLDVFIEIAKELGQEYQVVLVGTDDEVDKQLPDSIISIHRTQDQKELAEIYSAADLFVNPTREDTFPTVNMEALACGTPVITFDTGGSPEVIDDTCGIIIEKDDCHTLVKTIFKSKLLRIDTQIDCIIRAKRYDMYRKYDDIIDIYQNR